MSNFNVVLYHFKHRNDYQPIIRCCELLGAIAAAKGINKLRHVLATAFPTIDMRDFPVGAPAFGDLYLTTTNAKSLLAGLAPTLRDDPFAVAKLPKVIAEIEAIEQKSQEPAAVLA